ncbi:MAG: hypothetical protein K2X81_25235, partial [Candidatus Obscuribacterales bacterium]|nr:hypothetical protein [Candidatus Obscuribacterales bacterium]
MADIFREHSQAKETKTEDTASDRLRIASSNSSSDQAARINAKEPGAINDPKSSSTLPELHISPNLKSENQPFQFPYGNFLMGAASGASAYSFFDAGDECLHFPDL